MNPTLTKLLIVVPIHAAVYSLCYFTIGQWRAILISVGTTYLVLEYIDYRRNT